MQGCYGFHTPLRNQAFPFFIINTLLPNILKNQHILPAKYTHCLKSNFCLGHWKMEGCLTHLFPFSVCFIPLQPPPVYVNHHTAEWKLPLPTFPWTFWPDRHRGTQKKKKKHGKELRGTSEGLILWSLKALVKVTKTTCDWSTFHMLSSHNDLRFYS